MLFGDTRIMATLKEHEILCTERYRNVEARLDNLEKKIDEIHEIINGFQRYLIQFAFKSFAGLFVLVCGAVVVIKV
jgi:hypothetical protein